jgi:hypothetical protein
MCNVINYMFLCHENMSTEKTSGDAVAWWVFLEERTPIRRFYRCWGRSKMDHHMVIWTR